MRTIQIGAILDGAQRRKDGSVSLRFISNLELSTDEFMIIDTYRQANGWLLFKENEFKEEEIPTEDVETDIAKSQSVQLRDSLWVLYKMKGNNTSDKDAWRVFYDRNMQAVKYKILAQVHDLEELKKDV
jgi:hypothetical protein